MRRNSARRANRCSDATRRRDATRPGYGARRDATRRDAARRNTAHRDAARALPCHDVTQGHSPPRRLARFCPPRCRPSRRRLPR